MLRLLAGTLLLIAPTPALAAWSTTSKTVREAAKQPDIAAVLAAMSRLDTATMTGDRDGFVALFADDALVNSPFNNVANKAEASRRIGGGVIDYVAYDRVVDHIGVRATGEVVAMGSEIIRPRGKALHAGKTVHRRFTDIWRNEGGTWKLTLRQSTIFKVD